MLGRLVGKVAVAWGLKPKTTPTLNDMPALCDRSDRNANRLWYIAWAMFLLQMCQILVLPPSVGANLVAALVVLSSIVVIDSMFSSNDSTRSTAHLNILLKQIVDDQTVTIEHQREVIASQDEVIRRFLDRPER
jgi:hypothetical protein